MSSLTERERAKRAKMVARFNASKTNRISDASGLSGLDASALSLDVLASPKTEKKHDAVASSPAHEKKDSGKLDDYLSKKEVDPMQIVDGSDEQAERAVAVCYEEFTVSSPEPAPQTSTQMESSTLETAAAHSSADCEVKSELPLSTAPPFLEGKPKPLSINTTANKTTLSVEIPQTPTKNPPQSRSTPRSRRSHSIADAKKMLAAARKISSSPKPTINKSALKEHVKEVACKLDQEERVKEIKTNAEMEETVKEHVKEVAEVEEPVAANNTESQMEPLTKEDERKEVSLLEDNTDHEIPTKTLVTNSPSSSRLDKIAKIRARSPHLIHRHKGVSAAITSEEGKGGAKKRFSDECNDVLRRVPTTERWSDEFNTSDGLQQSDGCNPRLCDGIDGQQLTYGADTRVVHHELKSFRQSDGRKSKRTSNDLSIQRPSIESTNSEATGSTLVATDNQQQQVQLKKSKIASKAQQYRKWQQRNSTTTKEEAQSDMNCYDDESKESFASYQVNMQSDGYLFESKPSATSLVDKVGDLFEPRPQYKSEDNVHQIYETECPLTPSQMAYLYENQEYNVNDEQPQMECHPSFGSHVADAEKEMLDEPATLLVYTRDGDAPVDAIDPVVAPEPAILLMSPQGQSEKSFFSASEPSTVKPTPEKVGNIETGSQYKTLMPSKSDVSRELSLNQLTVSVSEAQSFVPAQQGSCDTPKLAGEAFLTMSKDTETPNPSNDFDDDQFQSNFDWPVEAFSPTSLDAFSPTSWGAGQLGPSSSGDSKWENGVPETPVSLTAPVTEEEKVGWDFKATSPAVVWGDSEEENAAPTKEARKNAKPISSVEWGEAGEKISTPTMKADLSSGGVDWNDEKISVVDERDDIMKMEGRVEAEARIGELTGLELEASVDRYEGFSEVEHRDCPSRMESRDGPSLEEFNDDLSPGIESRCSEETDDTATKFDPISLFGAAEEEEGSFPPCGVEGNDASAVSWASAKILKANDDSTNSAFPSLHAGNPMDASTLFGQKSAAQTPTNESLGSWWHSRPISERDSNINAAVRDVLNETLSQEEQRSDKATERCEISLRCNSESETPMQPHQQKAILQDPLSARAKRFSQNRPPSPDHDDDSIFGDLDLDDSSVGNPRQHSSSAKKSKKSRRKSSLSKMGTITSNAETEDVFSGVSVNSRQVKQRKDSTAVPMKSLLDGSTTTGSQSMIQKTKTSSKDPGSLPKVEEKDIEPIGLFMMDGTYGVINVNGRTSPSNASVTSDITTSVIFGGNSDYARKKSFSKRGPSHSFSMEKDIPESIVEIPDVLSDKPVCSPHSRHSGVRDPGFVNEGTENVDPQSFGPEGAAHDVKDPNKIRSLISDTTTDESTQRQDSNPTLLKRALLMVKNGKNFVEDSTKRRCETGETPSETVGETRPSVFLLPLALPLACGMLGASSFAYCASKGCAATDSNSADMMNMPNACSNDSDENLEGDSFDQLAFKDSQSNVHEYTVGSNRGLVDLSDETDRKNYQDLQTDVLAENEDRTLVFEEGTIEGEQTLNTNEPTVSTYDPTVTSDEESSDEDESDYEDSDCTDDNEGDDKNEEGTEITDIVPLSELEMNKLKDWESKDCGFALSPRSKKTLQQEQSRAYEKLLFYAYTALTVPLPNEVVEKGEDMNTASLEFPPVLSPRGAELRCEAMKLLLKRLGEDGMEVLKLNRERKWQSKFLTITKEVVWFKKSDDIRYNKIDCCPQGLLWVKKFNGHNNEHSVDAIGSSGKGGIMFNEVKFVSVTTDNFSLSKKQKKGKFKGSFTFVLHTEIKGKKRDILFRCANKDDICTLSSGFQAIIDRINNETVVVPKPLKSQIDRLPMIGDQAISPVAITKPFSPKATHDDRWEV